MNERVFIGLKSLRASKGEIFFCSKCLTHSEEITIHQFVEPDSNDDVSFDHWDDECPACGYVGILLEKTITRLMRFQFWIQRRMKK